LIGIRGGRTNSFLVHLPAAVATIVLGLLLQVSATGLAILFLCIGVVLAAELFNSSIERLAESITSDYCERIKNALDIASGAVLIVSIFAAGAGVIVFLSAIFGA
jgi:diacylglycerol kinase